MQTKEKIYLKPNGRGSYLMHVQFVGGESTEIIVDSGAEEGVCPWEWGHQFGTKVSRAEMQLKNASGHVIPHWGSRDVEVLFQGQGKCL
eukprot:8770652-Karenia_brevis.AAC.1